MPLANRVVWQSLKSDAAISQRSNGMGVIVEHRMDTVYG